MNVVCPPPTALTRRRGASFKTPEQSPDGPQPLQTQGSPGIPALDITSSSDDRRPKRGQHRGPRFLCAVALSFVLLLVGASWVVSSLSKLQKQWRKKPVAAVAPQQTLYNTTTKIVLGKINMHLVAHSHDDLGWLKSVDEYYLGYKHYIQLACVEFILDTVVDQLLSNPDRKFVEVEQAFFHMWWSRQTEETKEAVRGLVRRGQLEFINGGWSMHDEAITHYVDMIDQTTLGHRFLAEELGFKPRIGWQIDPFGHSTVQAYLLGAEAGMDAVFFARISRPNWQKRNRDRANEFVWRSSKYLGESAQILGGRMFGHYNPPDFFWFELKHNNFLIDEPGMPENNIKDRVEMLVTYAYHQAESIRSNHIMLNMGEDFSYPNALTWFKNMDKMIHYVNLDGRVNMLYSTPSLYVDAKNAANESWPRKEGDFLPYMDCHHCYWSGYYTSRTTFKGYVRRLSGLLQAARHMEAAMDVAGAVCHSPFQTRPFRRAGYRRVPCCLPGSQDPNCWHPILAKPGSAEGRPGRKARPVEGLLRCSVEPEGVAFQGGGTRLLEQILGIVQHHDAITGTAKQPVNDDYTKKLHLAQLEAEAVMLEAVRKLFNLCKPPPCLRQSPRRSVAGCRGRG